MLGWCLVGVSLAPAQHPGLAPRPATSRFGTPLTNWVSTSPTVANGYVADDKSKLRIGDKISFQILQDRDQPKILTVSDSGEVEFPYVGRLPAVDKTCKELAAEVKTLLEKDYYHRATVIVSLDEVSKVVGRVYVWGQVRTQGPVEILGNETLTAGKAILRAGGFGDFANRKKVKVIRDSTTPGGAPKMFELNMVEILEQAKTDKDLLLEPGDYVIVPARFFNF
jgi:polysaccharide export outer membrane protein